MISKIVHKLKNIREFKKKLMVSKIKKKEREKDNEIGNKKPKEREKENEIGNKTGVNTD